MKKLWKSYGKAMKKAMRKLWKRYEKLWKAMESYEKLWKAMEKLWKGHGNAMEKLWKSHGKLWNIYGKLWTSWKAENTPFLGWHQNSKFQVSEFRENEPIRSWKSTLNSEILIICEMNLLWETLAGDLFRFCTGCLPFFFRFLLIESFYRGDSGLTG